MQVWKGKNKILETFLSSLQNVNMALKVRIRIWISLAAFYLLLLIIIFFFRIPLRSQPSNTHNILLKPRVVEQNNAMVLKVAEKFAQREIKKKNKKNFGSTEILTDIFKKADTNKDGKMEAVELSSWIGSRVKEHLTSALRENVFIFTAIDLNPRNGVISWDEYLAYFLKSRGYDKKFIEEHKNSMKGFTREIKEAIMRDKAAWSEAAKDDPLTLNLDEFLSFRHPESSHSSILSIVEEALEKLDANEDGLLSEDEFSDPELNGVPSDEQMDEEFKESKLKEFKEIIDIDKNGLVDKRELLVYFNPRSSHHSDKDAANLIDMADVNEDGVLTLPEVLMDRELFMTSKMVDVARSFHDEF